TFLAISITSTSKHPPEIMPTVFSSSSIYIFAPSLRYAEPFTFTIVAIAQRFFPCSASCNFLYTFALSDKDNHFLIHLCEQHMFRQSFASCLYLYSML